MTLSRYTIIANNIIIIKEYLAWSILLSTWGMYRLKGGTCLEIVTNINLNILLMCDVQPTQTLPDVVYYVDFSWAGVSSCIQWFFKTILMSIYIIVMEQGVFNKVHCFLLINTACYQTVVVLWLWLENLSDLPWITSGGTLGTGLPKPIDGFDVG